MLFKSCSRFSTLGIIGDGSSFFVKGNSSFRNKVKQPFVVVIYCDIIGLNWYSNSLMESGCIINFNTYSGGLPPLLNSSTVFL
ncbi:hypothetical protein [Psychroflexus sp. MES1-P1E]|uniref:hypothetical protein n=1 Tax=Psychroflexus sp. MES1-P1E TaxID=2058320 RepID=UPI000C7DE7FB|nr:hypothetical protein [Psychroflexus sp. MES1-P1E]PKG43790.1 hypothetical protein CXF67_03130 [Psychroflexus sp. MES1-P1E]